MAIANGTRLGPYEVLAPLGAGGMGEVYRARDTRLDREVAVKVLPIDFSADADRLRRFEQEARAAGMLNHPNILVIYDIGTHEGAPYIVSELLKGEELRAQLNEGWIQPRKAIDYALQIARGLSAAHEKGITHRDLKPENLFLTTDGRVKILDFGLAKLTQRKLGSSVDSEAPTRMPQTDPGVVMGTVGYMSPEQVRGQDADHRADIFAFGAILYEMLTGKRAFWGDSVVEAMNAILKEEPPELAETNSRIPPQLERVLRRCLEKRPEQRFQSASDLGFAIEALSVPSGSQMTAAITAWPTAEAGEAATSALRRTKRERLAWIIAGLLLLGLLASLPFALAHLRHAPLTEASVTRFVMVTPEKATYVGFPTVSPDGRSLVFYATFEGQRYLWVRPFDSLTAQRLTGTDSAFRPFWSPDSRFIGFFTDGKLKKIEATGGSPQTLCDAPNGLGGAWNRDGVILFVLRFGQVVHRVSAAGGAATPVTTLDGSRQEQNHWYPQFLPDGRHFLYFARSTQPEKSAIYIASLDGPDRKLLLQIDSTAAYSASAAGEGYLLFARETTLMAQPFDARKLQLGGEPFPVAEEVGRRLLSGLSEFSVSDTGVLAYRSGQASSRQLVWFDRSGRQLGPVGPPGDYSVMALSPDEKRVAIRRDDPQTRNADIWLLDLARGLPSRFTSNPALEDNPVWSPDGSKVVFGSVRDGSMDLYQKASSGAGNEEALLKSSLPKYSRDWPRDGRFILYEQVDPKTKSDLWVLPLAGDQKPFPFLQTEFDERQGHFSPDGKWIAYSSDESGKTEVYVQSFPSSGGKERVSTAGGAQPVWRRDGKELFYMAPDNKLMVVEVKAGATFEPSAAKALFQTQINNYTSSGRYAVTADGQRFLVNSSVEETSATPITVVLNWMAGLKR